MAENIKREEPQRSDTAASVVIDFNQLTPVQIADAVHSQLGPKVQKEVTPNDIIAVVKRLRWNDSRPSRPVPHLAVKRLRFRGEKRISNQDPTPIDYDQIFQPGVNVILIEERNLVGKSTILKTIKFALTGDNADFDRDVKGWIHDIWLEFSLGERNFTMLLSQLQRENDWHGALVVGNEVRPLGEVIATLPRRDHHLVGIAAIQRALGEFFFREYSLASLGWTQIRKDGETATCSASWQTYFQAMRIKDDDHKYIICEPLPGLANQEPLLFMAFLGLNLADPLNQLGVENASQKKAQQLSEKEVATLNEHKERLQRDELQYRQRLDAILRAQKERQQAALTGDLPGKIAAMQGQQIQTAAEISELVSQQQMLASRAQKQRAEAKRIRTFIELQREFTGLDVTLCPRCSKGIDPSLIERETQTHECRLCNKATDAASPEDVERLEADAMDREEHARRNQAAHGDVSRRIDSLQARHDGLRQQVEMMHQSLVSGATTAYPTSEEEAEKGHLHESIGKAKQQIAQIEQQLASASGGGRDAEKQAKIISKVREVLKSQAEHRNAAINDKLKEMTQAVVAAIGAKSITGISCSPLGVIKLMKNHEDVTFSGVKNPGERFRIKLALFLTMMRLGRQPGAGRHPGFLLIDQLGAAEMADNNMAASAEILKRIDAEYADEIQIICSTARRPFGDATVPEKVYGAKVQGPGGELYAF